MGASCADPAKKAQTKQGVSVSMNKAGVQAGGRMNVVGARQVECNG